MERIQVEDHTQCECVYKSQELAFEPKETFSVRACPRIPGMEFLLVADIQFRCLLHSCHILAIAVDIMFEEQQRAICPHARTGSIQTCRAERHGASSWQTFVSATTRDVLPQDFLIASTNEVILLTLS